MGIFAKWIGGTLGWAFMGPLGALAGYLIGSVIDGADETIKKQHQGHPYGGQQQSSQRRATTQGDYMISLLVLAGAVLKADGKIMRSELDYVKEFFKRNFGIQAAQEGTKMLKDLLNQDIPVADVARQIKRHMEHASRLQLMHFLFGIAAADGSIDPREATVIQLIATNLGISPADYQSIESMFVKQTDWAYKVLEIDSSATDEEVKKAYRKMARKYHPDKVSYLGEDIQNGAKEKFQKVSEAYETIKDKRKIA